MPDGRTELLNTKGGMPIGVMEGVSFTASERTLADGEVFAFYSDGVSEARNNSSEDAFSEFRLATLNVGPGSMTTVSPASF